MKKEIKTIAKVTLLIGFLFIAFFSIQNFWQGYHDVDTAFNFLNLGMKGDINTDGKTLLLEDTYLRGVDRMTSAFVWISLDVLWAIVIGYIWRPKNR